MTAAAPALIATAMLVLTGCQQAERDAPPAASAPATPPAVEAPAAPPPARTRLVVALDPEGLRIVAPETGSTRLLAFGSPAEQVHEAVSRTRPGDDGAQGTNPECGAGALDYTQWSDLTLWFQNDMFVGWATNAPGPSTLNGVGVGRTRVQLMDSGSAVDIEQTTFGTEFSMGDISGLINDDGVVGAMWAGVSCNFR